MLRENVQSLASEKAGLHVNHLNGNSAIKRLATEWEVAVLNALSKVGRIEYEPKLSGNVSLDVLFKSQTFSALIEITTVSDRGLDDANPVWRLCQELIKQVQEHGLDPARFYVSVDGNWRELFLGGPKVSLCLPNAEDFPKTIFNTKFQRFLRNLNTSNVKVSYRIELRDNAGLTVSFDPTQKSFGCTHLSYTVPFTAHGNPVHNRLHAKALQLGRAGFDGIKGIILCDAGCQMLTRQGHRGMNLGGAEIIASFLNEEPSIGFVTVLSIESDGSHTFGPKHLRIVDKTYVNRSHRDFAELLGSFFRELVLHLPRPETTSINAHDVTDQGKSFYGGGSMAGTTIKISARTVIGILAGKIPTEEFQESHKPFAEHFARMLRDGGMLKEVRVEKTERDDDWVEFVFSERDPAISPFQNLTQQLIHKNSHAVDSGN
jgi:hypothetical protein